MTHQQILEKAIQKAIDGGWKMVDYRVDDIAHIYASFSGITIHLVYEQIIFNHDFARALWPPIQSITCPYCGVALQIGLMHPAPCPFNGRVGIATWKYHLQQMVIADDPIEYLGEHL